MKYQVFKGYRRSDTGAIVSAISFHLLLVNVYTLIKIDLDGVCSYNEISRLYKRKWIFAVGR